jgi:hypothetical protein
MSVISHPSKKIMMAGMAGRSHPKPDTLNLTLENDFHELVPLGSHRRDSDQASTFKP